MGNTIKSKPLALAVFCCSFIISPVLADDLTQLKAQLQSMQQQMKLMQNKLIKQEQILQQQQIAQTRQHQQSTGHTGELPSITPPKGISFGGAIEVKALNSDSKDWSGKSESDIVLDTFELTIDATANAWISGHVLFLYEQAPGPGRDEDNLQVDEAYITLSNPEISPFYLTAGRIYIPFGNFETNMISDPITLTLAETRNEVLQLGFETDNGFYGSAFVYNGDIPEAKSNMLSRKNTRLDDFGFNIGYNLEDEQYSLDIGAAYINNLATSNGVYDTIVGNGACNGDDCVKDHIGAFSLHAIANINQLNLIGEYITATEDFARTDFASGAANGQKLKPSAWNIEGAWNFILAGKEATFALGYQKSSDFYLDESTPYFEKAWLTSFAMELAEQTTVMAEWRHAKGYGKTKKVIGNNYKDEDLLQIKLSYDF